MRSLLKLFAVVAIVGVAASALAQDARRAPRGLRGRVVKVDGTNVVISTRARGAAEAKEVTVATDDKTEVTIEGKAGKVADLKAGMSAGVTPATGTATKIAAMLPSIHGKVVKVDGTNVVISVRERGAKEAKEVTVATDDKTEVVIEGKAGKVADLKADMSVRVIPETGTAAKIEVRTPRARGEGQKPEGEKKEAPKEE